MTFRLSVEYAAQLGYKAGAGAHDVPGEADDGPKESTGPTPHSEAHTSATPDRPPGEGPQVAIGGAERQQYRILKR
jgi:hypothetical protein